MTVPTTPSVVNPASKTEGISLIELAQRIKAAHEAAVKAEQAAVKADQDAVDRAITAGKLLNEAKKKAGHGQWLKWLKDNCPDISERTAQRYMDLADNEPKLLEERQKSKSATVADLTITKAVQLVSGGKSKGGQSKSDAYDKVEIKLLERLQDLELDEAEAAVAATIRQLKTTLAMMTKAAASAHAEKAA